MCACDLTLSQRNRLKVLYLLSIIVVQNKKDFVIKQKTWFPHLRKWGEPVIFHWHILVAHKWIEKFEVFDKSGSNWKTEVISPHGTETTASILFPSRLLSLGLYSTCRIFIHITTITGHTIKEFMGTNYIQSRFVKHSISYYLNREITFSLPFLLLSVSVSSDSFQ